MASRREVAMAATHDVALMRRNNVDRSEAAIAKAVCRAIGQTVLRADFGQNTIERAREVFHSYRKQGTAARLGGEGLQITVAQFRFQRKDTFDAIGADGIDHSVIFLGEVKG